MNIDLPQYTPLSAVFGPSHPLPIRRLSKVIAAPCRGTSHTRNLIRILEWLFKTPWLLGSGCWLGPGWVVVVATLTGGVFVVGRSVLFAGAELGARSLALCVVSAARRSFPPELGAHIALRTYCQQLPRTLHVHTTLNTHLDNYLLLW